MAINRVVIEGNLTRDADVRDLANGTKVCNFTVAVNEKRKNVETGEWEDAPVFVRCALFGLRAEKLSQYLLKGTKVTIDGKLRYSTWVKDDEKRHELSVIVDQLEFSGGKREQTGDAPAAYIFARRKMTRARVLLISLFALLAFIFIIISFQV